MELQLGTSWVNFPGKSSLQIPCQVSLAAIGQIILGCEVFLKHNILDADVFIPFLCECLFSQLYLKAIAILHMYFIFNSVA